MFGRHWIPCWTNTLAHPPASSLSIFHRKQAHGPKGSIMWCGQAFFLGNGVLRCMSDCLSPAVSKGTTGIATCVPLQPPKEQIIFPASVLGIRDLHLALKNLSISCSIGLSWTERQVKVNKRHQFDSWKISAEKGQKEQLKPSHCVTPYEMAPCRCGTC